MGGYLTALNGGKIPAARTLIPHRIDKRQYALGWRMFEEQTRCQKDATLDFALRDSLNYHRYDLDGFRTSRNRGIPLGSTCRTTPPTSSYGIRVGRDSPPNGFGKRIPKYRWLTRATGEGSLLNLECFDYCEYEIDPADRDREPSLPGEQSTWNSSEKTGQYGHG